MMRTREWKGDLQTIRTKTVLIPAGDNIVLEYVVKIVSVVEKPTETLVNRRNVEKPQPPPIKNEV